jgi:hypothetical protein
LEYTLPKHLDDGGISRRTGKDGFSCEHVRVDYRVSTGFEKRGNGRFPGRYTACDTDDCKRSKSEFSLVLSCRS